MRSFIRFCGRGSLNLIWILPLIAVLSGSYTDAISWRDHRVTIQIAKDINVQDVAASLTREDFRQINCLATNMYFEAGNQGKAGMAAVGDVVFNRLRSGVYPDRLCQVIDGGRRDKSGKLLNGCDFSWRCDGIAHKVGDKRVFGDALEVAYNQYLYREKMPDITGGSTYYHASYVDPHKGVWKKVKAVTQIGAHIFYRPRSGGEDYSSTPIDKRKTLR